MELKSLSSNWKKLQETLKKKDVSTASTPKRKRSDRDTQNDPVKKRKAVAETGKGKRTLKTPQPSKKQKRMSQGASDNDANATQDVSRGSSTVVPKDNEGRSTTSVPSMH